MHIGRDVELLLAALAAIAGVAGALILPNLWMRAIVLLACLAIAAYITGLLQQWVVLFR